MHIVTQTYYTLHLSFRDACEIDHAVDSILAEHDIDFREFPVLANLFGAIESIKGFTGGAQVVEEQHEQELMFEEPGEPDAES